MWRQTCKYLSYYSISHLVNYSYEIKQTMLKSLCDLNSIPYTCNASKISFIAAMKLKFKCFVLLVSGYKIHTLFPTHLCFLGLGGLPTDPTDISELDNWLPSG